MTHHVVPLDALLLVVRDGDERGWRAEFDRLWSEQQGRMDMLSTSIQETGIRMPILIGNDGRVWDGHHRLAAAHRLGFIHVPVTFSGTTGRERRKTRGDVSGVRLLTVADAATHAHVSERTISTWIKRDLIPGIPDGKRTLVPLDNLNQLIRDRAMLPRRQIPRRNRHSEGA